MSSDNLDQVTLEQQVRMLTEQLQQAQKMTSLGELVSTTTHEFNNVLMTIMNYAKMGLRHQDSATRDKCTRQNPHRQQQSRTDYQLDPGCRSQSLQRIRTDGYGHVD